MMYQTKGFFIVGTDTQVGKTTFSAYLLNYLKKRSYKTAALKPIASGCRWTTQGLRNQDAIILQRSATLKLKYDAVNPFAFEEPVAPHLVAKKYGIRLNVKTITRACRSVLNLNADYIIVEGAGGVLVPLNHHETLLDLAKKFNFPVILVVGLRLGCINHALLSLQALQRKKIKIAGWLGFPLEPPMLFLKENLACLKKLLAIPFLGLYPQCRLKSLNL